MNEKEQEKIVLKIWNNQVTPKEVYEDRKSVV